MKMRNITRPFGALVLGTSLALSPLAAPTASAGSNEELLIAGTIGALVLGTVAAAAAGAHVKQNGAKVYVSPPTRTAPEPRTTHYPRYPHIDPGRGHQPFRGHDYNPHRGHGTPHHVNPRHDEPRYGTPTRPRANPHKTLPSKCVIPIGHGRQAGIYVGKDCLRDNFRGARYLPAYCETTLVGRRSGYIEEAYNGSCLQRAGYFVAGGHRAYK